MGVIDWEKRFKNAPEGTDVFISVDGTDFGIMEQTTFDQKWYSHKFHGPGLRYEIGLSIHTGDIVWAYGGLPCGKWSDLKLTRNTLICALQPREMVLAVGGYKDPNYFRVPTRNGDNLQIKQIFARHETVD